MDVEGLLNLTIRLRELLRGLRVDQHGLGLILQTVEKSLRMTDKANLFPAFRMEREIELDLHEDNERHTIGELRAEVND